MPVALTCEIVLNVCIIYNTLVIWYTCMYKAVLCVHHPCYMQTFLLVCSMQLLLTDYTFACPTRLATLTYLKTTQPVWLYMFDHPLSYDGWGANFSFCNGHSCELVHYQLSDLILLALT